MRICYIWIENFKNFSNFGINIRNDLRFSYDPDTHILSREMQPGLPSEILGDQVLDATAILGINGAGKTNALELICLTLKGNEKLKSPTLIVYEFEGELHYINNTPSETHTTFPIQKKSDFKDFKDLNVIFFSNVFDQNRMDLGKYVQDISTNFKYSHRSNRPEYDPEYDIVKQLKFIYSEQFSKIKFAPPKYLEARVERSPHLSNTDRSNKNHDLFRRIYEQQRSLRKKSQTNGARLATVAIQGQFLHQLLATHKHIDELAKNIEKSLLNPEYTAINFRAALLTAQNFFVKNTTQALWGHDVNIPRLIDTLVELEHHLTSMNIRLDDSLKSSHYSFTLEFDKEKKRPYLELSLILWLLRSGQMSWIGISSGQKAYLNMFSSIWSSLSESHAAKGSSGTTLLCIDEADLYLHPRWQVEFMERIITCLPEISEQKTQIVITTHSPILISDLPSQCLTALPAPFTSDTTETNIDHIKTFGANLFDIYASTFGLKGQRTGNLSSKYISKILTILDADHITPEKMGALMQACSIIDDPLIKSHIMKRLKSR